MVSPYDKAAQSWNSKAFGDNVSAANLAALSDSTRATIDQAVAQTQRDNAITAGLAEALAFKPTNVAASPRPQLRPYTPGPQTSPRPQTRPGYFTETINAFGSVPTALTAPWASHVPAKLVFSESSGNWDADRTNSDGRRFVGALQFGQQRLDDMIKAGVLPQGTTLDQLKASPPMQVKAGNWHFQDYINRIKSDGLEKYIGTTLQGSNTPLTLNSLLAMAHLGGYNGMRDSLRTGGQRNPSDEEGTSLVAYAAKNAQ